MPSTQIDRIDGISTSVAVKAPVHVATTAAVSLIGPQTIDGFAVPLGGRDTRVLVKDQANAVDNGIYRVPGDASANTPWVREPDFDGPRDVVSGTVILVNNRTTSQAAYEVSTPDPIIIGITAINFIPAILGDVTTINYTPPGSGAVPISLYDYLRSYAVNVFDFLSPAQRADVLARTYTLDLRAEMTAAADFAIANNKALYLPSGGYGVVANNGLNTGWNINLEAGRSVLIFGDGRTTVVRRMDTATLAGAAALVWLRQREGASVYFDSMMFDGNEANCPVGTPGNIAEFDGDGVTRTFNYNTGADPNADLWAGTTVINGVETINQDGFVRSGTAPNFTYTFITAPAVGTKIRFYNIFSYEQSGNIKWRPGSGLPDTLSFNKITMTGMISDGYHANVLHRNLQINDWESYGRTRRTRADIQLSRIPTVCTNVVNYIGDSFEMEPGGTNSTHVINISNMLVRGALDMAGDVSTGADANVNAVNLRALCTPGIGLVLTNFFRIRGTFSGCYLKSIRRIERCGITFNDCDIVQGNLDNTTGTALGMRFFLSNNTANQFARFRRCRFDVSPGIQYGTYFQSSETTTRSDVLFDLEDCSVVTPIDSVCEYGRCGTIRLSGGRLRANKHITNLAAGVGFSSNYIIDRPERWEAPALFSYLASSGVLPLRMTGHYDAEAVRLFSNMIGAQGSVIVPQSDFIAYVDSDPTGRISSLTGMRARLKTNGLYNVKEWVYKNGNVINGTAGWQVANDGAAAVCNVTYDAPALADGDGTTARINGAFQFGDHLLHSLSVNQASVMALPFVDSSGVAAVRLQNQSGGSVDLASATQRIRRLADSDLMRRNRAIYDMPSRADGAGVTTTVSLPGVALGDFVNAAHGVSVQGAIVSAWVSAADTVSVRFQNEIVNRVASITVDNAGSGYTSVPTVSMTGAATATAVISGTIASIAVERQGISYTSVPTVTITGGGGTGATATAVVTDGRVTAVNVTNGGSGFNGLTPIVVSITGGGTSVPATASATISASIASITVTNGGSDYAAPPVVTITGGGGAGATATAVLSANIDLASSALAVAQLKQNFKHFGSAVYDPPSLADRAITTTTVTVTGAALGDFAVCSFSLNQEDVLFTPYVSAANTVTVILWNVSGGVKDLGSGTLRAAVIPNTVS